MRIAPLLTLLALPCTMFGADPGDPACLAVPAKMQKKAEQYIKDFDDPDIFIRDRAGDYLRDLGRLAYPALAAAGRNPSKLARPRIEAALAEAVPLEFEAQAEVFLEDTKGKYKHDMLGWNTLVAAAGDTAESRKMFAAVLESSAGRKLLLEAAKPHTEADDEAGQKGCHRLTLLWGKEAGRWPRAGRLVPGPNREAVLSPDEPVTFLIAAMLGDLVYGKQYYNNGISYVGKQLLLTDEGRDAVSGKGVYGTAFNKLMDAWADSRVNSDLHSAAGLYAYSGARPERYSACMVRLVDEGRKKEWTTGRFYWELAKIGDAECLACLRRCLGATTVLHKRDEVCIEDRDLALGYLVELTGQKVSDYGLSDGTPNNKYAFRADRSQTADEKRAVAFKKWAEWEKANPDKLKPNAKPK